MYFALPSASIGLTLIIIKMSSAGVFLLFQRPFGNHGNQGLTRRQWLKIVQGSGLSLITSLIWLVGLNMCGGLRTVLLWEHSDMALLGMINAILSLGTHAKSRGGVLFVLGVVTLLVFDNDQLKAPVDHPEGVHSNVFVHVVFWFLSFLGVPDHKGGVVLLLIGLMFLLIQRNFQRKLAVDVGGAKRLQALTSLVEAVMLLPWGVVILLTSPLPSLPSLLPSLSFSILSVVYFYIDSVAKQRSDSARYSALTTILSIFTFLAVSFYYLYYNYSAHHGLTVGVVLASLFLLLATLFLTRSVPSSQGRLVGYSAAGLPLYASQQQATPTLLSWAGPIVSQILENTDSRRILYFLMLNLSFTVIEMVYGVWTNSLGLISDSFHMLFDCTALVVGLSAAVITNWKPTRHYSFGYGRVEVLSGYINGLFLIVIAGFVLTEALGRLVDPPHITTDRLLFVSVVGFIVNLVGVFSFHSHSGHSHGHEHAHGHTLSHSHSHSHGHAHGHCHEHNTTSKNANMHGVYLHILADTLGSVGVIISSILVEHFGLLIADPICSMFIAILIIISVIPLLKSSSRTLLLATPTDTNINSTINKLMSMDGVLSVSDVHFWRQSSDHVIGTLHVQVAPSISEQKTCHMIVQFLRDRSLLIPATIQIIH
jgi:zinc transporter 5/7